LPLTPRVALLFLCFSFAVAKATGKGKMQRVNQGQKDPRPGERVHFLVHWILFNTGASISTIYLLVVSTIWEVKNFVLSYNPQITKARINIINLYKSNIKLNNGLSMLVGISEAIRVLFFVSILTLVLFVYLHLVLCTCKYQNSILNMAGNPAKTGLKALIFKSESPDLG
jgi:hypothetical protein